MRSRIKRVVAVYACCILVVFWTANAFSQYHVHFSHQNDPERLALDAKEQRLQQDQKNILVQQMTLAEFELRAQKTRRQLEGLSFIPPEQVSSNMQAFAAGLLSDLKKNEQYIAETKKRIDIDVMLHEEAQRQFQVEEKRYEDSRTLANGAREETWTDRIQRQNDEVRRLAEQQLSAGALQNLKLLQSEIDVAAKSQSAAMTSLLPFSHGMPDKAEYELCKMLEKKASEKDYDIAEINLLATKGLPGAENLDVEKTLKKLDLWAAWVKHETDRHFYKFKKAPGEYNNSEGYFRILMMVCTLQEDFKICYNKDPKMRAGPVEIVPNDFTFFGNSQDLFIHGLTENQYQGTCASLPVLYVAVGRRLGYPLKLVECKGHLFLRWEDEKERFNIEGTSRGLNCFPDQEYMEWPWPISKEELATGMYMKSLSPKREVAAFLELRSLCLKENKKENQHLTTKLYADELRKKEGVDLDSLNRLMKQYVKKHSTDGTIESALMYQTLTNTNSWRTSENERGAPGKHTVFAVERSNTE